MAELTKDCDFCEFVREYGIGIGVKSCGEINGWDEFEREYYFPYFEGSGITSYADVVVEKKIDQEAYLGVCEDARVGVSIIFQLQNNVEYMKEYQLQTLGTRSTSVTLAGLANRGKILLPIVKNEAVQQAQQEEAHNRMMLLSAARQGDSQALESLTLDDIRYIFKSITENRKRRRFKYCCNLLYALWTGMYVVFDSWRNTGYADGL